VARGDVVYGEKADIFSLGMLLYELATDGKQPFSDLKFRSEFDEAVITGKPIDPIVVANAPPWPDMQDLLDHMLVTEPEQRLNADQVRLSTLRRRSDVGLQRLSMSS
jgi:serine/threonine protein kinase